MRVEHSSAPVHPSYLHSLVPSDSSFSSFSSSSSLISVVDLHASLRKTGDTPDPVIQIRKDVILVVDVSGSMTTVIAQVRQTVLHLGLSLTPQDRIAIITFGSHGNVLLPLSHVPPRDQYEAICSEIKIEGSTNMTEGLDLGFAQALGTIDEPDHLRGDLAVMMLLSDGIPDRGAPQVLQHASALAATVPPRLPLVFHSFGYTAGHDAVLLERLTRLGSNGFGLYYYLQSKEDVPAAIGDCLGAMQSLILGSLLLSARTLCSASGGDPCPAWNSAILGFATPQLAQVGSLRVGDRQSFVISHSRSAPVAAGEADDSPLPTHVEVTLAYSVFGIPGGASQSFVFPLNLVTPPPTSLLMTPIQVDQGPHAPPPSLPSASSSSSITLSEQELHIVTHVMRVRIGEGLARFIDPAVSQLTGQFEALHYTLLTILGVNQSLEGSTVAFDEGILVNTPPFPPTVFPVRLLTLSFSPPETLLSGSNLWRKIWEAPSRICRTTSTCRG